MTVNKSQGQSFKRAGVYLPKPLFTHGQLYVAASRVSDPSAIYSMVINSSHGDGSLASLYYNGIVGRDFLTQECRSICVHNTRDFIFSNNNNKYL